MRRRKTYIKVYLTKEQLAIVDETKATLSGRGVLGWLSRSEVIAGFIRRGTKPSKAGSE